MIRMIFYLLIKTCYIRKHVQYQCHCFDSLNMYVLVFVWVYVYVNVAAFMFIYRYIQYLNEYYTLCELINVCTSIYVVLLLIYLFDM